MIQPKSSPPVSTAEASQCLAEQAPAQNAPLTDLQEWMTRLIGHDKALDQHEALKHAAALHFTGNDRLSPAEQINIYRVQFWLRHTGILIEHFDGLSRWLGQDRWQQVAEGYLRHPDTAVFALADLGHKMAEYLAALPTFFDQQLCVDMARLEWAYQDAFSAADDPQLSLEQLTSIPPEAWERARFTLSSSLHLLDLSFPVADLRRSLRLEGAAAHRSDLPEARPRQLVVYRRDRVLFDKELSRPAFLLLVALSQGTPLIAACEAVIEQDPSAEPVFEVQLAQWFGLWGKLGWIVDVTTDD